MLAAVDLGSNSFRMLVARASHGELRPLIALGERVQLAAGLSAAKLHPAAMARGLDCLSRFRQVLDTLKPDTVRVVGTNALRAAKNAAQFAADASAILGCPVEVISGREEARLIYLGVAHTLADDGRARLVADIGGGSTEVIVGERFEPRLMESLHMGCVSYRERFFPDGRLTRKRFVQAYEAACLEVLNVRASFHTLSWDDCVGSSGTLDAIGEVLKSAGWSTGEITSAGLARLRDRLSGCNNLADLAEIPGLKEARREVFPAGVAICCALFDTLGIRSMHVSGGALREGVLYDLLGRSTHEDVRERSVKALTARYDIDVGGATRVADVAAYLFAKTRADWGLTDCDGGMLGWAARLHEIGLAIAHNQFHKHGQYLIENADLPGFSLSEQKILGLLVRCHRRKFPRALFTAWPPGPRKRLERMAVLLRLAVLFKYLAPVDGMPEFDVRVTVDACRLQFPPDWLQRHPLTVAELTMESDYLRPTGYTLEFA